MAEQNAPNSNAENGHPGNLPPQARDWFWHPWYAKLWWGSAAIFWAVILAVPGYLLPGAIVVLVGALLHPFVIVPVLGAGFFRTWFSYHFRAGNGEGLTWSQHDDFCRDMASFRRMDPTDPSNSSYYGHPANPMSEASRNRRLWGID
ncbi:MULTISPECIES: hypothetical protein [Sphingobium]|jgi:hypothetical protein|uniref:hypothetical protein n=1 Tax=Sphingobium TaxID=165695 RepID=UPI0010F4B19C|nr:hypothetical protein [Sphingobium sp. RSMS]UXC93000.1 hypothetical protein EGM87_22140 [Sphingobium sp. RSMS]